MPDELTVIATAGLLAGAPAFCITACWSGDLAAGEKALRPLRSIGPAIRDSIAPIPYQAMQAMLAMPSGLKSYCSRTPGDLPLHRLSLKRLAH
ncbi:MAG: hypothetical protein WCA22_12425 [Candidatus Binatus sp.]